MKAKNRWKHIVIMFLYLFIFALCISFHLTIYGVESAHVIEDAHLASINSEYINSGDGNNNSLNHIFFSNLINRKTDNSKSNLLFYTTCAFSSIIIFIQLSEIYFYEQDYLPENNKRSLIAQKIRLNN